MQEKELDIDSNQFYEAPDQKPTVDELYEINNAVFLPPFLRLGKLVKINSAGKLKLLAAAFQSAAKRDEKLSETVTSGYLMTAEPYDKAHGYVSYHFDRCPIAEFAKKHGYLNIMPAFCNGDYPAMEAIGAVLIRKHTCANSHICDYLIMAGMTPEPQNIQSSPMKTAIYTMKVLRKECEYAPIFYVQ